MATLLISGVALAQQGGGGGQVDDSSVIASRLQNHERVRVPGAARRRETTANCPTAACSEPPKPETSAFQVADACGGDLRIARDRNGRIIRRVCEFN